MARIHGADCRVYIGGYDRSADLISVTPKLMADTHEVTNFASSNWRESDPGLLSFTLDLEGFYQPQAAGIGRQFEDLLGVGSGSEVTIIGGDANAVGDVGIVLPPGVLETRGQPITVGDLIKLSGSMKGSGKAGMYGVLLHPNSEETGTGTEDVLNSGASSANGGRGNLHVTAITGTWTITIDHSSDNGGADPYAALITFTQVTAAGGVTAETKEVTGTVKQYLRVSFTEDVAGSCTFVVAFARY